MAQIYGDIRRGKVTLEELYAQHVRPHSFQASMPATAAQSRESEIEELG